MINSSLITKGLRHSSSAISMIELINSSLITKGLRPNRYHLINPVLMINSSLITKGLRLKTTTFADFFD